MDGILITARLKSTRLPMKALIDVNGKPLLSHQIERIRMACDIPIIICTSSHPQDDPLIDFALGCDCLFFRGSEDDVLYRYLQCAKKFGIDRLYITYADEPFVDIGLMLKTITQLEPSKQIWVCNDAYPDGVFGYGFTIAALNLIDALKPKGANEVWGRMVAQLPLSVVRNIPEYDFDKNSFRLTVDYPEDLAAMKMLINHIGDNFSCISTPDLIEEYTKLGLFELNGFRIIDYNQRLKDQSV